MEFIGGGGCQMENMHRFVILDLWKPEVHLFTMFTVLLKMEVKPIFNIKAKPWSVYQNNKDSWLFYNLSTLLCLPLTIAPLTMAAIQIFWTPAQICWRVPHPTSRSKYNLAVTVNKTISAILLRKVHAHFEAFKYDSSKIQKVNL